MNADSRSPEPVNTMPIRGLLLVLALSFGATSLPAQSRAGVAFAGETMRPGSSALRAPPRDVRLLVGVHVAKHPTQPEESSAWKDTVARPWWHYPAIGAAIGITAGVIQAKGMKDPIGFPVDPIYVFPTIYGAAGAFVGILVDSAERERAARR